MENIPKLVKRSDIEDRIFTIRGQQVMIDNDLAELYNVPTKRLNEQVKRNIGRFPDEFRFQLVEDEYFSLRSQNATLKKNIEESGRGKHRKYLPYAFTEQGVAMLSAVLKSDEAVQVSVQIMKTFVRMRRFIAKNAEIFSRLDKLELNQVEHNEKFKLIFDALQNNKELPNQGIFFNGQIFDAYTFVSDLIRKAKESILLIDNYIDDSVLTMFSKRSNKVKATIYTSKISKQLSLDLKKHNEQYPEIKLEIYKNSHDRFLIIDNKELFHIGASLKDLGKKWFAFSKLNIDVEKVTERIIKEE